MTDFSLYPSRATGRVRGSARGREGPYVSASLLFDPSGALRLGEREGARRLPLVLLSEWSGLAREVRRVLIFGINLRPSLGGSVTPVKRHTMLPHLTTSPQIPRRI
jgi:hypothetical protein